MAFGGLRLVRAGEIINLDVESGISFPIDPTSGRLFYRTDGTTTGLWVYSDTEWVKISSGETLIQSGTTLPSIGLLGQIYFLNNSNPTDGLYYWQNGSWSRIPSVGMQSTIIGDVNGNIIFGGVSTLTLGNTGITANTYGTPTTVPRITVNAKGLSTQIDAIAIAIPSSQLTDSINIPKLNSNHSINGTWTFNSNPIVPEPTLAGHAVTKSYVDAQAAGIDPIGSVKVATTAPIILSGIQTIDSISLGDGDLILVKNQSDPVENGIYIAASGIWSRSTMFDGTPSGEVASGKLIFVDAGGTINGATSWVLLADGPLVVDTDPLVFTQFSGFSDITAGNGLDQAGNQIFVKPVSSSRITVSSAGVDLSIVGTPGSYNSVIVDSYGRVSAGSLIPYITSNQTITLSGDVVGSGTTSIVSSLSNTGVSSGTYGSSNQIPILTIDSKGRITSAGVVTISGGSGIPGGSNGQIQFNNSGTFGGDSDLSWNASSNILSLGSVGFPSTITTPAHTSLSITTGSSNVTSTSSAGNIIISAGNHTLSGAGAGGSVTINGGNKTATGANGGSITLVAGSATSGTGGTITLMGGTSAGTTGSVRIRDTTNTIDLINVSNTKIDVNVEEIHTKPVRYAFQHISTVSGTVSISNNQSDYFTWAPTGTSTVTFGASVSSGLLANFMIQITNGGAVTITWPSSVIWLAGSAPTLKTSGINIVSFLSTNGGTTWYGVFVS